MSDAPAMTGQVTSVRLPHLGRLVAALDRAQAGIPSVFLISGAAGMGKSVLARQVIEVAANRDIRAAYINLGAVQGTELFAEVAYELGLTPPEASSPPNRQRWDVFEQIRQQGEQGRAVLLVFDDLHRIDARGMALLLELSYRPPSRRLVSLLVVRESADTAPLPDHVATAVARLDSEGMADRLVLERLDLEETGRLIAALSPDSPDASRVIRDIALLGRGSPQRIAEIVRAIARLPLVDRQAYYTGSRVLASLQARALVEPYLRAFRDLPRDLGTVIEAMAVWRLPASIGDLAELLETTTESLGGQLEVLEEQGLIAHDPQAATPTFSLCEVFSASVIEDQAPIIRRQRLHDRAAEILTRRETLGDDELLVTATHIVRGARRISVADAERVVSAARELVSHSRYATAGDILNDLLERMREEHAIADAPRSAFVLLAESLSRSGAWEAASEALTQTTATDGPGDDAGIDAPALSRLARNQVAQGQDREALATYERILRSRDIPPAERVRAMVDAGHVEAFLGRPDQERARIQAAVLIADEFTDDETRAEARFGLAPAYGRRGEVATALRHALRGYVYGKRSKNPLVRARAQNVIAATIRQSCSLKRAERWFIRATRDAERLDDYPMVSWTHSQLGTLYLEMGEWEQAERYLTSAVQLDASMHRERTLRVARALLGMLHARRLTATPPGSEGIESTPQFRLPGGPDQTIPERMAEYELHLFGGDFERARHAIDLAYETAINTPGWENVLAVDVLPRRARAFAMLADGAGIEAVERTFAEVLAMHDEFPTTAHAEYMRVKALLAGARGEWDESSRLALAAAEQFGALHHGWRQATALNDVAYGALKAGNEELCVTYAEQAYSMHVRMGAVASAGIARRILASFGRRPPRTDDQRELLTPRQWEIAELANQGLTDAEIADALSISRRTVTTHMHNILRGAGLSSRLELRDWVRSHEAERSVSLS